MVAGWKGQGVWDGHVHAAIFKMDNQQVLLYIAIWNSDQCYLAAWMGGEFGGEWIHVYGWLSLTAVHLKLIINQLHPNTN